MIEVQDLERMVRYFTLIHHVRGRIRLRVDPSIQEELKGVSPITLDSLTQIPGIKSFKLNKLVASLVIEYDDEIFPFALWEELLQGKCQEAHQRLASIKERDAK